MIALLAEGVIEVSFDALGRDRDHLSEREQAVGGARLCMKKPIKPEAPGHNAEARLLAALPVRPKLRRIMRLPIFYELPENLCIKLIARSPISAHERVSEPE